MSKSKRPMKKYKNQLGTVQQIEKAVLDGDRTLDELRSCACKNCRYVLRKLEEDR